ncbi:hypothetical protein [Metamycoplasma neophronis]|uniref:YARHG domain-containing protein n=1 Tax=Metamycoplasma neophronis TaxID=872983 RepID=A0ABY2YZM4_9BACT|nr:hypothetical protein [Metamycoplasma neophronis]TPR53700.1 hypothetical protein FJR74_02245 [Metamycoplasma neophronis]
MAQKQKDTRDLSYDPELEKTNTIINDFNVFKNGSKFYKDYSELEMFEFFQEIRWMKAMDEKCAPIKEEAHERQNKIRIKYENYIEYDKWSDSPMAQKTRPLSKLARFLIIAAFVVVIIAMLLIIIGLNKWW